MLNLPTCTSSFYVASSFQLLCTQLLASTYICSFQYSSTTLLGTSTQQYQYQQLVARSSSQQLVATSSSSSNTYIHSRQQIVDSSLVLVLVSRPQVKYKYRIQNKRQNNRLQIIDHTDLDFGTIRGRQKTKTTMMINNHLIYGLVVKVLIGEDIKVMNGLQI